MSCPCWRHTRQEICIISDSPLRFQLLSISSVWIVQRDRRRCRSVSSFRSQTSKHLSFFALVSRAHKNLKLLVWPIKGLWLHCWCNIASISTWCWLQCESDVRWMSLSKMPSSILYSLRHAYLFHKKLKQIRGKKKKFWQLKFIYL